MTAAVTPVPQLLMMGLDGSMPLDLKRAWRSDDGSRAFVSASRREDTGTEMEYGI